MKIYGVPGERAAGSLIDLLHYRGIAKDDRRELLQALNLFSEHDLDIVDCILCAKAANDHLFTFDANMIKLVRRMNR